MSARVSPDLVDQDFAAGTQVSGFVSDITCVKTRRRNVSGLMMGVTRGCAGFHDGDEPPLKYPVRGTSKFKLLVKRMVLGGG